MEILKQIPPINDILQAGELEDFRDILGRPFVSRILNEILTDIRAELKQGSRTTRAQLTTQIAAQLAAQLRQVMQPSLRRVINGSGVVLHTNLGRSPLPKAAMERLLDVCGRYSNLEFDLSYGVRGSRDFHVQAILRQLFGSESAVVVNNNAAAVLLVLNTLGDGGEVIVSRGEEVEIGGSFRIPDVMSKSGAQLREVGTTNRTRIQDYEGAIGERTRLLMRVHPSNYRIIGFTDRPTLDQFAALGRRRNIPTFEDLGSGCVVEDESCFNGEPTITASLKSDVDIVCFSGDKLLGGPQAGIILGRKALLDRIRQNPLYRALRVDKLTLSVLEVVLRMYAADRLEEIPVWRMMRATDSELKTRVDGFVAQTRSIVRPVQIESVAGGGSMPESAYPSWGISIELPGTSATELGNRLRNSEPPVLARIHNSCVLLDFRTIFPEEEAELLSIIERL